MDIITLDFETVFTTAYSLTKMSTEEYIRDPRFETHGVGIKINDSPAVWVSGDRTEIEMALMSLDIPNNALLCHHAQFDGFILSQHFDIKPKVWLDTMSMGRALVGAEVGVGLKKLLEYYGLPPKGEELMQFRNIIRLNEAESKIMGKYCINDVEQTYALFETMAKDFPKIELKMIDMVIRMFTEPMLQLNSTVLKDSLDEIVAKKLTLLMECDATKDELMSNPKLAEVLIKLGVEPPRKLSLRTGKIAYAFAKTDPAMQALLEHPDERVQAVIAARLGVKSTIAETRTQSFLDMSFRGPAPVYLKYSGAAQTHRLSGGDKKNWQNLSRGSRLRDSIEAPYGHSLVVIDSANIEARILDYLAGEEAQLAAYRAYDAGEGPDIYCVMGGLIYKRPINKKDDPDERFLGKVAKLGLGYGMGKDKFYGTAMQWNVPGVTQELASDTVDVYRKTHDKVVKLWAKANNALAFMTTGEKYLIDRLGIVSTEKNAILLPNGLQIKFPQLQRNDDNDWIYITGRNERIKIYGGKVVENIVQALARIVVMEQTLRLAKKYKLVLSVHDEAVFCVPDAVAEECLLDCMIEFRTAPSWAPDLPLNAEAAIGKSYGEAK